jgi:hypothetical protein
MARVQSGTITQRETNTLPIRLLLWLTCGTIGSVLFTTTYLIEGVTRPGYSALEQPISALSLGPGGWVQQVNFVVFGLITIWTAFAWRAFLKGGAAALWYPILRGIQGGAIIVDGFFSQDPAGYPKDAVQGQVTLHGEIHLMFAFVSITAIAFGFFVLARRFAKESAWRGWATVCVVSGILTIVLISTFGALSGQHSPVAGLFERLATSIATAWFLVFLIRLWLGTNFGRFHRWATSPTAG